MKQYHLMGPRFLKRGFYRQVVEIRLFFRCEAAIHGNRCPMRAVDRRRDPQGIYRGVCVSCLKSWNTVFSAIEPLVKKSAPMGGAVSAPRVLRPIVPPVRPKNPAYANF